MGFPIPVLQLTTALLWNCWCSDVLPFETLNRLQSHVCDSVLNRSDNIVVCAPTASGKTVVFDLAIIRAMASAGVGAFDSKIVYLAPNRALCAERADDWQVVALNI